MLEPQGYTPDDLDDVILRKMIKEAGIWYQRELEKEDQGFYDVLQGVDDLGVVRAYIYLEREIHKLLDLFVSQPKYLEKMEMDYFQKIHLLVAFGLRPGLLPPLKALGKLRNDFAHELGTKLTNEREKNLYKSLQMLEKGCVQKAFESTNEKTGKKIKGGFSNLKPPDKFILIAVALRLALISERLKLEK